MEKQRILFMFYSIVFGWMGAHRYYLGQTACAVFYSLFFWTGIPLLVALIEFIVYSQINDKKFDAMYNKAEKIG